MALNGEQVLLRVFVPSADRSPHAPTYERIVQQARRQGLAGATVFRGLMGFSSRGVLKPGVWSVVDHVPMIVEMVDRPEKIGDFINGTLATLMREGTATLERAAVMMYRHRDDPTGRPLMMHPPRERLHNLPRLEMRPGMTINESGVLLRIFIGESDRFEHRPLYEAIVQKAREMGLAGATVLRGTDGFGANSVVHRASLVELSTDLPVVIEIADQQEKIEGLLPVIEPMVKEGMITMEYVAIIVYRRVVT
jgi:uncharacterized protein